MDVFKLLKQDHRAVEKLFKRIEKSSNNAVKQREKTFQQIAQELDIHTEIEEQIVYPRLKEYKQLKDMIGEAFEEHHVAKQLIEEIKSLSADDEQWKAKVSVLKEIVKHHVEEEEQELFPKAQKALGKEEPKELGKRIEQEKKRMQSGKRRAMPNENASHVGL